MNNCTCDGHIHYSNATSASGPWQLIRMVHYSMRLSQPLFWSHMVRLCRSNHIVDTLKCNVGHCKLFVLASISMVQLIYKFGCVRSFIHSFNSNYCPVAVCRPVNHNLWSLHWLWFVAKCSVPLGDDDQKEHVLLCPHTHTYKIIRPNSEESRWVLHIITTSSSRTGPSCVHGSWVQ